MAQTVSDHIIQRLYAWGVRRIYGYPGDGINGLVGAIERSEGRVRFLQSRHEESAAFMACAHAKFTGQIGVCMATSGPGAIHLLNGLYDAQMDHQPVVAIVGQSARTAMGADYQQEVDLLALFKDVAHHYVHECNHPAAARHQIDRAMRIAFAERVVTCVIIPHDVQELDGVDAPPREHDTTLTGIGHHRGVVVPAIHDLHAAAEILNSGKKVAMLVGAGALGASSEVLAVADALGAGVAKALLGKAVVPDDLPFVTGSIGLLGTEPSDQLMQHCDTLLMVGTSFPYVEYLPKEGQARGVQIDLSPRMLSLRYPMEASLHGDAAQTLRALLPLLDHKEDRRWRRDIEGWVADWWELMEKRAMQDARPINPQRVFWELSPRLPDNAILTADSGSGATWWARDLKIRAGMMASLSGNLATMGPAMPYAAAAKFAYPERPVIATVGDGAMQMIGNSVLVTIAAHYREWSDPRLVVIVLNNGDLNMVTWEQRVMVGDPKFNASQNLPAFPYAKYAELIGLAGIEVTTPEQIGPALDQALALDRPVVVECHVDPEVPPLPPHISFKQARNFASSIAHGDPHRWRMVEQAAKQAWAGLTK
ncbi:MAG TPA: thiamine pyrophosphate-requiring protein [Kofleriaceae bacterium]|jgi:pyruvate dehydrogenase (quinone)|nr:thiamine pyrophosphate-requiring protein [Kofleriaceae bacterium]